MGQILQRTALVCGSSDGIGYGIAAKLLTDGLRVIVNGRDPDRLARAGDALGAQFGPENVIPVCADLATLDGVTGLVERVSAGGERVDVLVSNTGGPRVGEFFDITESDFFAAFELVVMSFARLMRAFVPPMREQGYGRVVLIASTAVREPVPMVTLTNTMRPAAVSLAKDVANRVAADGVTVNSILVGPVMTARLQHTIEMRAGARGVAFDEEAERYLSLVPAARFGEPSDIAGAVSFLASEGAGWLTGAAVPVDGGRLHGAL